MSEADPSSNPSPRYRAGDFILKKNGVTHTLSAHEAIEFLDESADSAIEILRIHRVHPDGKLDLIGVKQDALFTRDTMLFIANDVRAARRDYDALVASASNSPPPCHIDLRLAHAKEGDSAHVVALTFPLACTESVGQWLVAIDFKSDSRAETSPERLGDFEMALAQLIFSTTLERAP